MGAETKEALSPGLKPIFYLKQVPMLHGPNPASCLFFVNKFYWNIMPVFVASFMLLELNKLQQRLYVAYQA